MSIGDNQTASNKTETSGYSWHNLTESSTVEPHVNEGSDHPSDHTLVYILIPVGSILFVALLAFITVVVFRKTRLEQLRHHLMPLYSFDPGEEDGDWESELLEDQDREQEMALRIESPSSTSPKYTFTANRR